MSDQRDPCLSSVAEDKGVALRDTACNLVFQSKDELYMGDDQLNLSAFKPLQ